MKQLGNNQAITNFMHPVVYTGVKPVFIVGEELVTDICVGQISEAVWVDVTSNNEFTYISKFAVSGKIILDKYNKQSDMKPFKGRLALVNEKNLENVVVHKNILLQIKELELKRYQLLDAINKDFESLKNLSLQNEEVYLFVKKDGEWDKELFSDFDINIPYKLISIEDEEQVYFQLKNPKTGKIEQYLNRDKFHGYFLGSLAEIAGLKLKDESYTTGISSLKNDAKTTIKKIEWLDLNDVRVQTITQKLPKHPFEEYFNYTKKEDVRDVDVSEQTVDTLKAIILQHMPENNNPLGMNYIAIDKLLFLFHMVITREEALRALEECDIVYEAPGIVLGYNGEHKLPPKYLVPIAHVAHAYEKLPSFMSVCQNFKDAKSD